MDLLMLSRVQFAMATAFHFLFVPVTLGLSILLALMETKYVRTGDEKYKRMAKFFGKLFMINVAVGVVTGITLEFQFGTNWSRYSEYVGDVFGSVLAIEATVAFFLESTFIAVWFFGWEKLSAKAHAVTIWLVAIGANISALWILFANAWMQHPVGYELSKRVISGQEVEVTKLSDFLAITFNPYAWHQIVHTLSSAYVYAGFFVMGISAYHLLKKTENSMFKSSFKAGLVFASIALLIAVIGGHGYAAFIGRDDVQPAKLAAMEAQWETEKNPPLKLFVIPDTENKKNAVEIGALPGMLNLLLHKGPDHEVRGLKEFYKTDQHGNEVREHPPVAVCFFAFRIMVGLGFAMILYLAVMWFYFKRITERPLLLRIALFAIPIPLFVIQIGWLVAEIGRQPWIVYGLLKTADAHSISVAQGEVWFSLVTMTLLYTLIGITAIYLLIKYAKKGPEPSKTTLNTRGEA